jgi:hypothetical protein
MLSGLSTFLSVALGFTRFLHVPNVKTMNMVVYIFVVKSVHLEVELNCLVWENFVTPECARGSKTRRRILHQNRCNCYLQEQHHQGRNCDLEPNCRWCPLIFRIGVSLLVFGCPVAF